MSEFVYERSPLVEVVLELRWATVPMQLAADAKIDPHYAAFRDDMKVAASDVGFKVIEPLQPIDFPLELRPYVPDQRFRRAAGSWPLFQIGPGIMSVNIVPPYEGWTTFRAFVKECIGLLYSNYPIADRYLKFQMLELRYINAFDASLGFRSYYDFINTFTKMKHIIPDDVLNEITDDRASLEGNSAIQVQSKKNGDLIIIHSGSGKKNNLPAALLNISCRQMMAMPVQLSVDHILTWVDDAHLSIRNTFENILSNEMKRLIGPKREVA